MKIHRLKPNTPEWLAYRATMRNASDAPSVMGCSPYKSRTEFMHERHIGFVHDVSKFTQRIYDSGHAYEAFARPLAEPIIGESLDVIVGSEGEYSSSFDGLTLMQDIVWEHKRLNEALRAALPTEGVGGFDVGAALPLNYRVQMEQQCMVSKAGKALFTASDWTDDGTLIEIRHCWYAPDAELRAAILNAWDQFFIDLAAYVPPPAAEPTPVGKAPDTLPALLIQVTGAVTASNLQAWKQTALSAIQSVNRALKTDQDFADARKSIRWCEDIETRLKAAKEHALSQTADIDALFKAMDDISAEARRVRLDLDKVVTKRGTEVKEEAVAAARAALDKHIAALNAELAPMRLQPVAADFAGSIKGLRSIASMQDALNNTLANGKIAADGQARGIRSNVAAFKADTGDDTALQALFADLGTLVHKAGDDFKAVMDARIGKYRADQAEKKRRADEARAAEIAAAEQRGREDADINALAAAAHDCKGKTADYIEAAIERLIEVTVPCLQPAQRVKDALAAARASMATALWQAEDKQREDAAAEAKRQADAALAAAASQEPQPVGVAPVAQGGVAENPAQLQPVPRIPQAMQPLEAAAAAIPLAQASAAAAPIVEDPARRVDWSPTGVSMVAVHAPDPLDLATLTVDAIGERLGFALRADCITGTLGVKPSAVERGLPRFTESQFLAICRALLVHVRAVGTQHANTKTATA